MKVFSVIMKLLAAAAAVVGAIYVAATYGDKIVAWAKSLLSKCPCCCDDCTCSEESAAEETVTEEAPAEEAPAAEEVPAEEVVVEEAPAEAPAAPVIGEDEPVADESDFEG